MAPSKVSRALAALQSILDVLQEESDEVNDWLENRGISRADEFCYDLDAAPNLQELVDRLRSDGVQLPPHDFLGAFKYFYRLKAHETLQDLYTAANKFSETQLTLEHAGVEEADDIIFMDRVDLDAFVGQVNALTRCNNFLPHEVASYAGYVKQNEYEPQRPPQPAPRVTTVPQIVPETTLPQRPPDKPKRPPGPPPGHVAARPGRTDASQEVRVRVRV